MLAHLPNGHGAAAVRQALVDTVQTLPPHLKRSLTWNQGAEMAAHHAFSVATDMPVYFCDPPGSEARTRTRTAFCGSTSPRAAACPGTLATTSTPSRPNSTTAHARRSTGKPQPSACTNYSPPDQTARAKNRASCPCAAYVAPSPRVRQAVPAEPLPRIQHGSKRPVASGAGATLRPTARHPSTRTGGRSRRRPVRSPHRPDPASGSEAREPGQRSLRATARDTPPGSAQSPRAIPTCHRLPATSSRTCAGGPLP